MNRAEIYAEIFARMIIIFVGYLFSWIFFLLTLLGSLGQIYLANLFAFITSTRSRIAAFDQQLNKKA